MPTSTDQHGSGECCQIAGWGKVASDQTQLNEFITRDAEMVENDSTYKSIYPLGFKTKLFPDMLQYATNYIQDHRTCSHFYQQQYKSVLKLLTVFIMF